MKRLIFGGGLLQVAALFLLFAVFSRPAEAGTTTRVPDCGYLNARPCTPFDNEAYNIYFGFSTQCDFGLYVNTHNKCVNASRDTISKQRRTWVQWALSEQRGHVSSRIPLNFNTTFGTHNSYSSYNSGFQSIITTDQKLSLYDQLEAGDGIASAVINYDVYRDRVVGGQHVRGGDGGLPSPQARRGQPRRPPQRHPDRHRRLGLHQHRLGGQRHHHVPPGPHRPHLRPGAPGQAQD